MALSESLFLFQLVFQDLELDGVLKHTDVKHYYLKCKFGDIFSLEVQQPRQSFKTSKKKGKTRAKISFRTSPPDMKREEAVLPISGSVLFACNVCTLMWHMKTQPIEIDLWSREGPTQKKIGTSCIPWNFAYLEFLHIISTGNEAPPVNLSGQHCVINENTTNSGLVKLQCKLSLLDYKVPKIIKCLSENNLTSNFIGYHSSPIGISYTIRQNTNDDKLQDSNDETNTIKILFDNVLKEDVTTNYETEQDKVNFNFQRQIIPYNPQIYIENSNNTETIEEDVSHSGSTSPILRNVDLNQYSLYECPPKQRVYCVAYCLVETDFNKTTPSSGTSEAPNTSNASENDYGFKSCGEDCPVKKMLAAATSENPINIPADAANVIKISSCKNLSCPIKERNPPPPRDDRLLLDFTNVKKKCCEATGKVEEVVGEIKAKLHFDGTPCECSCECTFGFVKKTTYCTVCGGYERPGEDLAGIPTSSMVHPCPVYHKLVDLKKLKTLSASGSDSKASKTSGKRSNSQRSVPPDKKLSVTDKKNAVEKKSPDKKALAPSNKSSITDKKNADSETDTKKSKKKKKDDRFKFNYGYQGIPPHIGHDHCAEPCAGTLGAVPRRMGWLWNAENVPGMKFRPGWRPGATHKQVVHLLKMAKNPGGVQKKKKKKDAGKKKKNAKRPLLIIHKKSGEFSITMETMKNYSKPRTINQYPYEDVPLLSYTIGRTAEENYVRQKKKERAQRRLERAQREFIQSAFKDVCREICLKAYQQALGLLPESEDPPCRCYPAEPDFQLLGVTNSCSCSEESGSIGSETDSDEWIVEFTPPNALFDPTFKPKKLIKVDNESQYNYLDYRVKLLDRYGNAVPRFFKGPDGKQQCSDLGGFWGPDHTWLDINVDGYVAPDGRWAPMTFIGPNGETVDAETGKFQAANGRWLMVGVDGFVDGHGRWRSYPRPRGISPEMKTKATKVGKGKGKGDGDTKGKYKQQSEASWSCFGDASPRALSQIGIVGHGPDRKLLQETLKTLIAQGEPLKIPQPSTVPRIMSGKKRKKLANAVDSRAYLANRMKCQHAPPSQKGVIIDERGHKKYFRITESKSSGRRKKTHKQHVLDTVMFPPELYP